MRAHLPLILLWVLFLIGQLLYMLKRAYFAVNAKSNPIQSYRSFFGRYGILLLIRGAVGAVIFWGFASYPSVFTKLASLVGFSWNLDIPLIPPLAFFAGLGIDIFLDIVTEKSTIAQKLVPKGPDTPDGD
jgi:hypothetical protein